MARSTQKTQETVVETPEVVEVTITAPVEEKTAVRKRSTAVKIAEDELIECMNGTTGMYGYESKNGYSIDLDSYGDTVDVPFGELKKIMSSQQKKHLKEAWLIILDEEAVEALGLKRDYENVYNAEQVDVLLTLPSKIEEVFPKMSGAQQEAVLVKAKRMIANNELGDLRVVTALKNVSGIDLYGSDN